MEHGGGGALAGGGWQQQQQGPRQPEPSDSPTQVGGFCEASRHRCCCMCPVVLARAACLLRRVDPSVCTLGPPWYSEPAQSLCACCFCSSAAQHMLLQCCVAAAATVMMCGCLLMMLCCCVAAGAVLLQAFKKLRADLGPFSRALHSSHTPLPAAAATPADQHQQQQQGTDPAAAAAAAGEGATTTAAAAAALGGALQGSGTYLGGSVGQLLGGLGGTQHGSTLSLSDLFKMDEDTQVGPFSAVLQLLFQWFAAGFRVGRWSCSHQVPCSCLPISSSVGSNSVCGWWQWW